MELNQKLAETLESFSMVRFHSLDISDEDSIIFLQTLADQLVQYDEYRLPDDKVFNELDNKGSE